MVELPKVNSIVIATAKKVLEHGAYFTLDEYGSLEAYMPIGEVSSSRIVDIEDAIKVGKKYVCKVIRVDPSRSYVDISLKRVTEQERRKKLIEWKRNHRAEKLIEMLANKIKIDKQSLMKKLSSYIGNYFEDYLALFEKPIKEGSEVLDNLDIDPNIKNSIIEIAKEYIRIPIPELKEEVSFFSLAKDGINQIKEILNHAYNEILSIQEIKGIEISYLGATRFLVRIQASNYKIGEIAKEKFNTILDEKSKALGVSFSFKEL